MMETFNLEASSSPSESIFMHTHTARKLGFSNLNKLTLRFGLLSRSVTLRTFSQEASNRIRICPRVIEYLNIPLFCRYELKSYDSELLVGPFMGILTESKEEFMYRRIRTTNITRVSLFDFTLDYDRIGGAILAFSEEGVDISKGRIHGYMYNPEKNNWEKGIYAYPAAMFKKIRSSSALDKHFHWCIGKRKIFNTPVFNKWQMHKMIDAVAQFRSLLPETILYRTAKDIHRMLDIHKEVYVKPISGENGIGICKVSINRGTITIQTHHHYKDRVHSFASSNEASRFFTKYLFEKQAIVQQALKLYSVKNRIIDFRLILIKNQDGRWRDMGVYARYAQPHGVITNMNAGAEPELGEITLRKAMHMKNYEADKMRERMSTVAMSIAQSMDEWSVCCGNLGFDLAIDRNGQLKLIEVNQVDPGHSIAYEVGRKSIYRQIRLLNMLYLKRLTGFGK